MTKTGSTAIEAALMPYCDIAFTKTPRIKHMTAQKFNRFMRPYLKSVGAEDVETACLIREPIDWLGSWYRYRRRPDQANTSNSTADISFDTFVSAYLSEPQPKFAHVGRPARFVSGKDGDVAVDHLFRYDHMSEFQAFLAERMRETLSFGKVNVSPAMELSLSPDIRRSAEKVMARDYEIYESAQ
jgi:hypothetical protein